MHLIRTKPEANLHRFYSLEIVRGLIGYWGLVRRNWYDTEAEAKDAGFELHIAKAKRGYE